MNLAVGQIRTMFDFSIWARNQLLGTLETLEATQITSSEHRGVYGSIHNTMAHLAVSQWLWLRRCKGESPLQLPKGSDYPTLEAVIEWWDIVHAEAMQYLATIGDADLEEEITYTAPDGKVRTRKRWHMLLQVTNHQTEHRSQIATMLGTLGIEVPQTDLVVYLSNT